MCKYENKGKVYYVSGRHGFVTIVNMTTCSIFGIYIYLNDLKLGIRKYHLLLQLVATNENSISNDNSVACHVSTRCYN